MSKKTNSLLYRFGISTLWVNKSIRKHIISNTIKLETIIYKELKKKKLNFFCVFYTYNYITIFIYNNINNNKILKKNLIKYYSKVLNMRKIIIKFGLSQLLLINLIKCNIWNNFSKKLFFFDNFLYFCYKYVIKLFIILEINYNYSLFEQITWIFNIVFLLIKNKEFCVFEYSKINFFICNKKKFIKLRKINGLIKLTLLKFFMENILYNKTNFFFMININHIFFQKGILLYNNVIKKYRKQKFLLKTLLLSTYYMNSTLITDYISTILQANKRHRWLLRKFIETIEIFFYLNIIKFKGFQLRVSGKLNGKMRKSKYHYKLGKVKLQSLKFYLTYSFNISYTKFGVLSIKIWLLNDNFKI